jgi:hypothetical protein
VVVVVVIAAEEAAGLVILGLQILPAHQEEEEVPISP